MVPRNPGCPWCGFTTDELERGGIYCDDGRSSSCHAQAKKHWGTDGLLQLQDRSHCRHCGRADEETPYPFQVTDSWQHLESPGWFNVCPDCFSQKESVTMGVPPQKIMSDKYGPFVKLGAATYRPQASLDAPGTNIKAHGKFRNAAGVTKFTVGEVFDVTPYTRCWADADGVDHLELYVIVATKDTRYSDPDSSTPGRRELWCIHTKRGPNVGYWSPLVVDTPQKAPQAPQNGSQTLRGVVIPNQILGYTNTLEWISKNLPKIKGEPKLEVKLEVGRVSSPKV